MPTTAKADNLLGGISVRITEGSGVVLVGMLIGSVPCEVDSANKKHVETAE